MAMAKTVMVEMSIAPSRSGVQAAFFSLYIVASMIAAAPGTSRELNAMTATTVRPLR
jgi:hypothetical protein